MHYLPFLSWIKRLSPRKIYIKAILVLLGFILTALIWAIIHISLSQKLISQRQKIGTLKNRLEQINQQLEKIPAMYQAIDYQKIPELDLATLVNQQHLTLRFLQRLAESTPPTLYLQQIKFEKNQWIIEGVADGVHSVLNFNELLMGENIRENSMVIAQPNSLDIHEKNNLFHFRINMLPRSDEYLDAR